MEHNASKITIPYGYAATLVKQVNTDSEGFFQVVLAPGTYSVFIVVSDNIYANSGDGQGGINPLTVVHGAVTYRRERLNLESY